MPYKPLHTPLLRIASAHGWDTIVGLEAMVEQGLAQQRMWVTGDPGAGVGSDESVLSGEEARRAVFGVVAGEVGVKGIEVDLGAIASE